MAGAYVDALRVFDANGPYRLVGYGFGAFVAFEMARQLLDEKAEVALLILLAAEPPRGGFGFLAGGWKQLFFGKKDSDGGNGRKRASRSPVTIANQEAARKFSPASAQLLAHIFTPTQNFPSYKAVQSGWQTCCEEVVLYQVPCTGRDMMAEPAVESLAAAISKLARAEELDEDLDEE
jgi:thioesterase domain-containing protein